MTAMNTKGWTMADARSLCRDIESVCPAFGCHVALTGGVLYKDGERKDLDLVLYRIRQVATVDVAGLLRALRVFGIESSATAPFGWLVKATYDGMAIDLFFPDHEGEYPQPTAPVPAADPQPTAEDIEF